MKKLFTLMIAALLAIPTFATVYESCPLTVTVNGEPLENDPINVTVKKEDNGKYSLELKNFILSAYDLPVGTIEVNNVDAIEYGGTIILSTQQNITIQAGDDKNYQEKDWLGPDLQEVPITFKGEIKGDDFNAILNIPLGKDMLVGVQLGKNVASMGQLPNAGFEGYHTATYNGVSSEEPNGWHSFMSATGSQAERVASIVHTWSSTDVRTNPSTGSTKSVKVASAPVKIQVGTTSRVVASANGTITTGRLKAGSMLASSKDNCSFLDFTSKDKDGNGDPFYAILNNKPDAVKVWVKYSAGDGNKNPQATISAILTNGQYAQDPEKDKYNDNIIARASKTDIASNNKWEQIEIPFTYSNIEGIPVGALVTMSTCAVASGGSQSETNPDVLYVDDIEMVYNCALKSIKVNGYDATLENGKYTANASGIVTANDIEVESDGKGAYITKLLEDNKNGGVTATIIITSNDLKESNMYTLDIKGATTGIKAPQSVTLPNGIKAIYNLAGQQVGSMTSGQVYIIKTTDGQTKKVIKK